MMADYRQLHHVGFNPDTGEFVDMDSGDELDFEAEQRERMLKRATEFIEQMTRQTVAHEEARSQLVAMMSPDMVGTGRLVEITSGLRMLAGADRALGEAVARIVAAMEGGDLGEMEEEAGPEYDLRKLAVTYSSNDLNRPGRA